jgi:hypothetical protein
MNPETFVLEMIFCFENCSYQKQNVLESKLFLGLRKLFSMLKANNFGSQYSTSILFEFLTLPSLLQYSQKFLFIQVVIIITGHHD